MITKSDKHNPNYLCKIVIIDKLRKHNNADKLQIATIDFQDVVTGLDTKIGDIYVYFPVESKINKDFLSYTNSFRNKELNKEQNKTGFFEENCRVKAVKLRGEKSCGYIVPVLEVEKWSNTTLIDLVNQEFDTINNILLVEKYLVKAKHEPKLKQGQKPQLSRLIEGQIHLHVDTENLRKNVHKLNPQDIVSITYKTHGTSWWVSNVLVKRKINLIEKILQKIGVNIKDTEYSHVYGSRKVVKNKSFEDPKNKNHYFGYDLWKDIADSIGEIPKGMTLYGECLGYTKDGGFIQKGYDYNCLPNTFKLEVYRITQTNSDGIVTELTYPQIVEVCNKLNLTPSYLFYYGKLIDFYKYNSNEELIQFLEKEFNEKDCFMCSNKVPEEGIVLRKESLFNCESYKLKSFKFLEHETHEIDQGLSNIEDNEE